MTKFDSKAQLRGSFISHIGELCLSWEYPGQYLNIRLSPDETEQIRSLLSCEHKEQINRMIADYELEKLKFQIQLTKLRESGEYENADINYAPHYFNNVMLFLLEMLQEGKELTPEQAYQEYMKPVTENEE